MKQLKNKKVLIPVVIVICLTIAGIAIAMSSTNYDLSWNTSGSSSGGGDRSSTNYQLTDVIGQTAPGVSSSGNYTLSGGFLSIMPISSGTEGTMVDVYVALQGTGRPSPTGWEVPLTVCFCPDTYNDSQLVNPGSDSFCFSGTAAAVQKYGGTRAYINVGPVASGTYHITTDSNTTLLNVKKDTHIE